LSECPRPPPGELAKTGLISRRATDAIRGVHLARHPDMPLATCRWVLAAASLLFVASPARAEDPGNPPPHVRPESESTRELVALAVTRSPTVRDLIARIERSDVVVYIRHRSFPGSLLQGQIGVLSSVAGRRYLIIEIACGRIWTEQISTLGHELYHAIEIADHPSVVDTPSLAAFYERYGTRTSGRTAGTTYETAGARATGFQVRREAFMSPGKLAEEP
jgi:hypothetical protein